MPTVIADKESPQRPQSTDVAAGTIRTRSATEGLMTPEEVAERLRVTRRTIYAWLKIGRLRGLRAGKGWRIAPADLEAFLLRPTEWETRLDESLSLIRSQVPTDISDEDIAADLEAAREEIRRDKRKSGV